MGESIIFVDGERIGQVCDSGTKYFQSDFLERYRQNLKTIRDRNAWKNEGRGAAFRGEVRTDDPSLAQADARVSINGVDFLPEEGRVAYSVSSADFSGVFVKRLSEDGEAEGHVIHNARMEFGCLAYNAGRHELAVSVRAADVERHIALLGLAGGSVKTLTEGDSVDENPSWGRGRRNAIYYNSCGIGRDMGGGFRGLGPSAILRLDMDSKSLDEIAALPGHDCLLPREDASGNLYFLKKPHINAAGRGMSLIDVLLVPFRILRGFFRFLEFFTHKYTGETFNTRGVNPARSRQQDAREVFIQGNLINVEKTLQENRNRGEEYPGIAPANWQLMKRRSDGSIELVKKGVLDYDLAANGEVVYSNGKYIVRLKPDGKEQVVEKVEMAVRIRVCE